MRTENKSETPKVDYQKRKCAALVEKYKKDFTETLNFYDHSGGVYTLDKFIKWLKGETNEKE